MFRPWAVVAGFSSVGSGEETAGAGNAARCPMGWLCKWRGPRNGLCALLEAPVAAECCRAGGRFFTAVRMVDLYLELTERGIPRAAADRC